uniref:NADH dehydrogenase subunit 11 n=1 Tax=Melosira undulata TaxID=2133757 RepID=A0A3G1PWE1_9STRA|nr:NADH dehydrogenase subunit 11 [Melosira undulata]AVR57551.1 NADH dehydrogenase subunit 11 [Melosira undulata]
MNNKNLNVFFINNIKIYYTEKNRTIIDDLENLNFKIPHFCYHSKLSIAGNCRMCLIELKNSPKPLISCAMTLTNKMEIFSHSPLVKKARENILEFLLLNHPLDCPICDQGGECDLQDQALMYGTSKTRFFNFKRTIKNKNLGPIVKTVMTRCIHCTKCIRFANEIANVLDLGVLGRGYSSEIGTYIEKIFNSELSGNIIDICPVGALTNKPYAFVERNWELEQIKTIDFSDSFGNTVLASIKNNSTITKIQPMFCDLNHETFWISDKTRFNFESIFSKERLIKCQLNKIKINNWALLFKEILFIQYFQYHLLFQEFLKQKLNIIIGETLSIELLNILLLLEKKYSFISVYSLEKSNNEKDFETFFFINNLTQNLKLNSSTLILLIGINSRYENSILNIRLQQRYNKGNFKIFVINSLINLLIPYTSINSNSLIFKEILEGNHFLCQELIKAKNPLILYNHSLFLKKTDLNFFFNFLQKFKFNVLNLNYLNSSLVETNINYLATIKKFTLFNFKKTYGFFFFNVLFTNSLLNKFIELLLLKSKINIKNKFKFLLNFNHFEFFQSNKSFLKFYNINIVIDICGSSFYETKENYLTTENIIKTSSKIINQNNLKTYWKIIRQLYNLYSKHFLSFKIEFNQFQKNKFLNFLKLNYFPVANLNNFNLYYKKSFNNLIFSKLNKKIQYVKNYKLLMWLDDFFLGGKDFYSKKSKTLIECSKLSRLKNTNFNYIS